MIKCLSTIVNPTSWTVFTNIYKSWKFAQEHLWILPLFYSFWTPVLLKMDGFDRILTRSFFSPLGVNVVSICKFACRKKLVRFTPEHNWNFLYKTYYFLRRTGLRTLLTLAPGVGIESIRYTVFCEKLVRSN